MGIGIGEILLILIIIGLIMWVFIKYTKVKANKLELELELPMRWFCFYTYFLLPFSVLSILAEIHSIEEKNIVPLWLTALTYGQIALTVTVFIGLYMRRLWGWYLNYIFLVFLLFINLLTISGRENRIGFLVGGIVYILANVVYFRKRESFFS